jgi:hypothetical protein
MCMYVDVSNLGLLARTLTCTFNNAVGSLLLTKWQCKKDHFGCTATSLRSSWKIEHHQVSMHKKYDQYALFKPI